MALTVRQTEMLEFIRTFISERGMAPTLKEIGAGMGVGHVRVHQQLEKLKAAGVIAKDARSARSIRLLPAGAGSDRAGAQAEHAVPAAQALKPSRAEGIRAAVERALRRRRFRYANEKELQEGLAQAFAEEGIDFRREHSLAPGDIVDFLIGPVAVEVKIGGSLAGVTRQLHRYAQHEPVEALVLVTGLLRLGNLPETLNGKALSVVSVGGAFL